MADHYFCRSYLTEVMKTVRKHTTPAQRKDAWTWGDQPGRTYEFHGPDGHYWYGSAHCRYEARAKGWEAWLTAHGHDKVDEADEDEPPSHSSYKGGVI